MASAELYSDGTIRMYDGIPDLMSIFPPDGDDPPIIGHAPTSQTTVTQTLATEDYVDDKIGNINAVLDEINGEVI
jgi:hypothetical protein